MNVLRNRIENPRVTGSIPVRATNQIKGLEILGLFCF